MKIAETTSIRIHMNIQKLGVCRTENKPQLQDFRAGRDSRSCGPSPLLGCQGWSRGRSGRGTLIGGVSLTHREHLPLSHHPLPVQRALQGIRHFTPFISLDPQDRSLGGSPRDVTQQVYSGQDYSPFPDFPCSVFIDGFPNLAMHPDLPEQLSVMQAPGSHYKLWNQNFCIFNKLPRNEQLSCEPAFRNHSPRSSCFK